MNRLVSILKLTRIEHSIMLVIAVVAAEALARGVPGIGMLLLSLVAPIFVSMSAFAINDYFDVHVDRLNRKRRPIVTGELSRSEAKYIAIASAAIGIASTVLINAYCFAIALVFALLAFLYSYRLKEVVLVGNAYVAFSMAIPFIYGSYVVSSAFGPGVALITAMVFLSGLGREVQGTIRDYRGDIRVRRANTLPRLIGNRGSAVFALALYAIAIVISVYLFLDVAPFTHSLLYAFLITISDLLLAWTAAGYLRHGSSSFYSIARNVSLSAMLIALIAFLIVALA